MIIVCISVYINLSLAIIIVNLISCTRDSAPGQKECDTAIGDLNRTIHQLDQASLEAIRQSLLPRDNNTLKVCAAFHWLNS